MRRCVKYVFDMGMWRRAYISEFSDLEIAASNMAPCSIRRLLVAGPGYRDSYSAADMDRLVTAQNARTAQRGSACYRRS